MPPVLPSRSVQTHFEMVKNFLPQIFCTAVQTFLPAGWTKSRKRCCLSARRSAYAFGCVCTDLDGRTGGIKHREEIAAMQYRKDKYGNDISALGYGCMRFTKRGTAQTLTKQKKK